MQGRVNRSAKQKHRGFGLIEVLAALLVTTVGVLGMAGLQSKSLQHNHVAYLRSQAVIIGNDMMDRIRVNRSLATSANDYVVNLGDYTSSQCTTDAYPDICETGACNGSQLAEYDIKQWKFQMACLLPDADGSITIENSPSGRIYVITMQFDETRQQQPVREVVLRSAL